MQRIGQYLLANNIRASLIVLACMLLPWPLNAGSAVIIALVSLQQGSLQGLGLLAWAILPAIAATWRAPEIAIAYDIAFITAIFCWGFASLLRLTRSWARVLELVALGGIVFIAAIRLLPPVLLTSIADSVQRIILQNLQQAVSADLAAITAIMQKIAPYLLGSLYTVFALMAVIGVMLARLWQLKLSASAAKGGAEFYNIRVSRFLAAFSVAVVVAMFSWQAVWLVSLSQVILLPFVFAGFSLLIYVSSRQQLHKYARLILLIMLVMILLFLPRYLLISLALLGFVDSWINFRKWNFLRIKRASS